VDELHGIGRAGRRITIPVTIATAAAAGTAAYQRACAGWWMNSGIR
jgi:hypothetical protein